MLDEENQTLASIDTASDQFCFVGLVQGTDPEPIPHPVVSLEYRSLGTIKTENRHRVIGRFAMVDLTLRIDEFEQTLTTGCKLRGAVYKGGQRIKSLLQCKVGEDLSAFDLTDEQLGNVRRALPRDGKHVKINARDGRIRISQKGVPAPSGVPVPLGCDLGGGPG